MGKRGSTDQSPLSLNQSHPISSKSRPISSQSHLISSLPHPTHAQEIEEALIAADVPFKFTEFDMNSIV